MFGRIRLLATLAGSALVGTGLLAYHPPAHPSKPAAPHSSSQAAGSRSTPPSAPVAATTHGPKTVRHLTAASSHRQNHTIPASISHGSGPSALTAPRPTPTARVSLSSSNSPVASAPFATVPVARSDYGLNVFSYDQQLNASSTVGALQNLGMAFQQFPNDNEWSWTTNTFRYGGTGAVSLDQWGQLLNATGSSGLFIFNYDENPTFSGGGTPADAAQLTQYIVQHNLPIHAIVIGSEEYGSWDYSANLNPSTSASYYAQQAALIAQAIHGVDPAMSVGVVFDPGTDATGQAWNETVLRATAPYINFVSVHQYPLMSPVSNSQLLTLLPQYIGGAMQYVRSELSANVPPSDRSHIQIWITEFNPYWQPTVQTTEPVYGAAMVESAILWRALGASRVVYWSYDGQAHSPTPSFPVDTTPGTAYALFAIAGDGVAPELPMNQLYPSGLALAAFMHAVAGGGTLSAWAGSTVIAGEVQSGAGYHLFLVNESGASTTIGVNGKNVTLAPASYQELTESGAARLTSAISEASYTKPASTPSYSGVPTISSAPASMYPGETVTVSGSNFGSTRGSGYVAIAENGVSYGAPGNAYTVRVLSWSDTKVSFEVPNGYSGPALTAGSTATVRIGNGSGVVSSPDSISVVGPPTLSVSSISPDPISAGEYVTIYGNQFGSSQGSGYVWISQNGVNWGAPGNAYPVAIKSWTNTAITFLAPTNAYEVDGHWEAAVQGGSDATLEIVTASGAQSSPLSVPVVTQAEPSPTVSGVSVGASNTLTIDGTNFGSEPALSAAGGGGYDQGLLQIADLTTGGNYGYSGNWYGLYVHAWSSTQIVVQFATSPPASGNSLSLRFYEPVNGTPTVVTTHNFTY